MTKNTGIMKESMTYLASFCNTIYRSETKAYSDLVKRTPDHLSVLNEFSMVEVCDTLIQLESMLIYHAFDDRFALYTMFFIEHDVIFFEYLYSIIQEHTIFNLRDVYKYLEYCIMTGCLFELRIDGLKVF